ncbi:MAG: ABC transporter ATP-binding protein [Abitibacteriaceae bacterium]|nr:ABC transporter ATP-binding protein [Abditibacteriaceae bacterium]
MLCVRKLAKRYGARVVFRDVNFEVEVGTVAAVLGSNGAGKSTLLKIVAGLTRPTSGRVQWLPTGDAQGALDAEVLQWQCGLAAPDAPVYRELTVGENLEFFGRVRGVELTPDAVLSHLEKFSLHTRRNDLAMDLSSGLRARLQLAVATLHRAPLLLLDEPSANLDEAGRAILQRVVEAQREQGLALIATNDPRDLELCDERIEL